MVLFVLTTICTWMISFFLPHYIRYWGYWHDESITHWGLVRHICVTKLGHHWIRTGLSPVRRIAITWTNVDLSSWVFRGIHLRANLQELMSTLYMTLKITNFMITVACPWGQWVNSSPPSAAYTRQWTGSALVPVMACRLFGAHPLPEPMLAYCQLDPWEQILVKLESKYRSFHSWKCIWICRLRNGDRFVPGANELMWDTKRLSGVLQACLL